MQLHVACSCVSKCVVQDLSIQSTFKSSTYVLNFWTGPIHIQIPQGCVSNEVLILHPVHIRQAVSFSDSQHWVVWFELDLPATVLQCGSVIVSTCVV